MKKTILVLIVFLLQPICATSVSAQSLTSYEQSSNFILNDSRKDRIDWVYKVIDGKLYKRLYNFSQKIWIGDWIIC